MPRGARAARVADLGELGVLESIVRRIPPPGRRIIVGIGDDTAALRPTPGALTLFTTDAVVENVHFRRSTSSAADVGWKALAINASDIAAMGGRPTAAVVSLMLPPKLEARWVDGFVRGLVEMAQSAGIAVVGGNLAEAPVVIVDVALLGEVSARHVVRRDGALPGDLLAVTGTLGRASAGLTALERRVRPARLEPQARRFLARAVAAARRPSPRLTEGRLLARGGSVHAMIDVSDGLALDLWRVCEASGLGVHVDAARLPVDDSATLVAAITGRHVFDLALRGGEDYELLVALERGAAASTLRRLHRATGTRATIIGEFRPARAGRVLEASGRSYPLDEGGWTHFRTAGGTE